MLAILRNDKLILLGNFYARVGTDRAMWPNVFGQHSVGNPNRNGSLLLSLCAAHELCITNTLFQQGDKYKTTWMHPRCKHWHMLYYFIVRHRDMMDVNITRAVKGSGVLYDHVLSHKQDDTENSTTIRAGDSRLTHAKKLNMKSTRQQQKRYRNFLTG